MEQQLSLHLKNFNKRIQVMNQTNSKELILTATEARNIQAELFDLLAHMIDLTELKKVADEEAVVSVGMDGGGF